MKGVPIKNADDKRTGGFPIVAIGASAGGIESFTDLFQHIPEATGMAYVFIQHTSPDHNSKLIEVLGRTTRIPVLEAKDKLKVKPDTIYVIPPNREMKVEDGILVLSVSPSRPLNHSPINHFFISLSEHYKEKAIGVLLSGNAPDGTLGLKAIKAEGGISRILRRNSRGWQEMQLQKKRLTLYFLQNEWPKN
jgi:two-component system CheB/CheR fusion protein